jgi:pilus assembly protein CpaB
VEKNEPVLKTKVTEPGQRASLSALLDEGQRAVTVRVDDVRGIAGLILPGDRVDVVLIRAENRQGEENFADVLLEFIKVLAIDQLVSERDQPTVAKAVTLQVTSEQAQKILLGQNVGRLSLVLRQSGEGTAANTRRVTDSDIGLAARKKAGSESEVVAAVPPPPPPPKVERPDPANVIIFHGTKRETYPVVRSAVRSE